MTIVIIAYNREKSLERILTSLNNANYPVDKNVRLVISIDKSNNPNVEILANQFDWEFGEKIILAHSENLGLRKHIFSCMALTEKYDEVIILEDDNFVSPFFYEYAIESFRFYGKDENVCGISLYSYDLNEFVRLPFIPIEDGFDNYFMQVPSSWGQAFNKRMWKAFESSFQAGETVLEKTDFLPECLYEWKNSWKRDYFKYMSIQNKYFVFPRESLTTNFGDVGANYTMQSHRNQVNLLCGKKRYTFSTIHSSKAIYDLFYEIKAGLISPELDGVEMDLFAYKNLSKLPANTKVISTKELKSGGAMKTYACIMYPLDLNIRFNIPGEEITMAYSNQFESKLMEEKKFKTPAYQKVDNYVIKKMNTDLVEAYMRKTKEYRIGKIFTSPFRWLKRTSRTK